MTRSLVLAGGCFWCVEHDLRKTPGVVSVTSGYLGSEGGGKALPTYENHKEYREVVLVEDNDINHIPS
jgi:peptide-methionine (S)-S-oxide reductase